MRKWWGSVWFYMVGREGAFSSHSRSSCPERCGLHGTNQMCQNQCFLLHVQQVGLVPIILPPRRAPRGEHKGTQPSFSYSFVRNPELVRFLRWAEICLVMLNHRFQLAGRPRQMLSLFISVIVNDHAPRLCREREVAAGNRTLWYDNYEKPVLLKKKILSFSFKR